MRGRRIYLLNPKGIVSSSTRVPTRVPVFFALAGFTLIELILVMALLSVVLAVSAPALSNFFRGRNIDSEARRIVSLIRYAQTRAVSEGVPMILWMDLRRGTYGLQQESGYTEGDAKALTVVLGKDLRMEVADLPAILPSQTSQNVRTDPNVPRLRFLPDGLIGDTSPRSVVLRETGGESIWITQTRNRLSYEIHANVLQNAFR